MNKKKLAIKLKHMGTEIDNSELLTKMMDKYCDERNIDINNATYEQMINMYNYYLVITSE